MGTRAWAYGVVVLVVTAGCVPSLETRSAGQVGCSPEEISISDDRTHFGLLQSAETWTAECHGRTFICTQMNETESGDRGGLSPLMTSKQVSCTEEAESPVAEHTREARQAQAIAMASQPRPLPPTGAAGFELGQPLEDAERRCVAAGKRWLAEPSAPSCSGPAQELGFDAELELRFCAGRTCEIGIEHRPPATSWANRIGALKAQLEAKYGRPGQLADPIPAACRAPSALAGCLESGRLELRYGWHWPSGEEIAFVVGKPRADTSPSIRITYRRGAGTASLSSL